LTGARDLGSDVRPRPCETVDVHDTTDADASRDGPSQTGLHRKTKTEGAAGRASGMIAFRVSFLTPDAKTVDTDRRIFS
jgi:hypothetical protein